MQVKRQVVAATSRGVRLRRWGRRAVMLLTLCGIIPAMGGCGLFRPAQAPAGFTNAGPYAGLADKSLAIVIYTLPATVNEYAGVREEISAFVTKEMRLNLPTTRLLDPADVIAWQDSTINWYGVSIQDIGKHFSVDRVLFIEVLDYSTRKSSGVSDMQGHLRANCKIVEKESATSEPAWTGIIDVSWPRNRPLDPTQTQENAVRLRTLEVFSQTLVGCFSGNKATTDARF